MKTQSEYIEIINKAISEIPYPNEPKGLYSPIEYTLDCGGKRLRRFSPQCRKLWELRCSIISLFFMTM